MRAVDAYGPTATGYAGTVTFTTTDPDPGVVLPADYAFTADDGGEQTLRVRDMLFEELADALPVRVELGG